MIDSEITVLCTNNNRSVMGHILTFKEGKFIQLAINTVKVSLNYNPQSKEYRGIMGGLELTVQDSDLPRWRNSYDV